MPLPSALADGEFGRISRTAAQAFKARAALYEGTRRKFHGEEQAEPHLKIAYEAADSVIQSGEHTLYTKGTQPYKDLFEYTGEEASEHVLVKLYGYQETQLLTHNYPYQMAVNYGVSRNFLNLYLNDTGLPFEDDPSLQLTYNDYFDGRDPRLAETALRRGVNTYQFGPFVPYAQSRTGFGIRKYVRNDGVTDQPSTLDYPLLRYAEVLLTYAEARFEHDGIISDEDLNRTVNALRDRVGMAHLTNEFVTSNHLDMRTELRRERSGRTGARRASLRRPDSLERGRNPFAAGCIGSTVHRRRVGQRLARFARRQTYCTECADRGGGNEPVLRSEEGLPLSHSEQRYCSEPRECRTESQLEITVNQLLR